MGTRRASGAALIGPNAILQMIPVIERVGGADMRRRLFEAARLAEVPSGAHMIDEAQAAQLHQALRRIEPDLAPGIAREAGLRTADYILAHRIPAMAQWVLKRLPAAIAARLLSKAIAKNAWTFAGSGQFRVIDSTRFEVQSNPIVTGEHAAVPLCHWHAAVFERLFDRLVAPGCICRESQCGACGAQACRFELNLRPQTA